MQHHLDIDPARCVGCGCCARECPQYLLRIEEKKCVVSGEDATRCHGCGHCLAVCPAGALVLDGIREPLPDCIPLRMTAEGRAQLFQGRRSIRHYRQDPVPREVLEICLDMARYAPTGGNTQQVADAIQTTLRQYQRFEKGEQKPGFDNLIRLADCFQVSLDYLAGRTERRSVAH